MANKFADLVGLGRVLIADSDWPLNALTGYAEGIRTWVGGNQGCLDNIFSGKEVPA